MTTDGSSTYGLGELAPGRGIAAPDVPFQTPAPRRYRPRLGLIGCGGISEIHLRAYRAAGFNVAILCSRTREKAERRRAEFFPDAAVTTDWREVLARDDIEVVNVTPHPRDRIPIVEAALRARKHVLSQKPLALDLATARRLVDFADASGVQLAVNQNGRFAPHFAWIRNAVRAGLLGELRSIDVAIHWNHQWVAGTPFDATPDLVLFDFGIHWFDFVASLLARGGESPGAQPAWRGARVTAGCRHAAGQRARQPLLAHATIAFEQARATLLFDGASDHFQQDTTTVSGTLATVQASGPDLEHQSLTFHTAAGVARPALTGSWFTTGFEGAMAELLTAIEEQREPLHSARGNLATLELAFAACESARTGVAVAVGGGV